MRLLLDTNALIWALIGNERLGRTRSVIADPRNHVYVSVASAWEMAIKVGLGKLKIPPDLETWLPAAMTALQFTSLPIDLHHAIAVERLPRHHSDPFDRLLIAQATTEGLRIVTDDSQFERYGVHVIRC